MSTTSSSTPSLHPQNDRVGDEGIGDAIMEYLNYYRQPAVYVTEDSPIKHENPMCPDVKGNVHRAICREDAFHTHGSWCDTCRHNRDRLDFTRDDQPDREERFHLRQHQ